MESKAAFSFFPPFVIFRWTAGLQEHNCDKIPHDVLLEIRLGTALPVGCSADKNRGKYDESRREIFDPPGFPGSSRASIDPNEFLSIINDIDC
jgi:hypothetical protein